MQIFFNPFVVRFITAKKHAPASLRLRQNEKSSVLPPQTCASERRIAKQTALPL
jgi:hypothetical protein